METRFEGHVEGVFTGYEQGRVYRLSDGSLWRQDDSTDEYVYRERPAAKPLYDRSLGRLRLDVEGTSHTAVVVKDHRLDHHGTGAF